MSAQQPSDQVALTVCFSGDEDVVTRYATNLVVQHTEHEFVISFYEARIPPLIGTPEENRAVLQQMGAVTAQCVARIVVAPGRMPDFVRALQENLERYQAHTREGNA